MSLSSATRTGSFSIRAPALAKPRAGLNAIVRFADNSSESPCGSLNNKQDNQQHNQTHKQHNTPRSWRDTGSKRPVKQKPDCQGGLASPLKHLETETPRDGTTSRRNPPRDGTTPPRDGTPSRRNPPPDGTHLETEPQL